MFERSEYMCPPGDKCRNVHSSILRSSFQPGNNPDAHQKDKGCIRGDVVLQWTTAQY